MPERSKDQLIAEILSVCIGAGASKTRIVYQVNMNFHTIKPHLDQLIEKNLIEVMQGVPVLYKTTGHGKRALECHREIEIIYS
jgi:predicted transcriptional regulator